MCVCMHSCVCVCVYESGGGMSTCVCVYVCVCVCVCERRGRGGWMSSGTCLSACHPSHSLVVLFTTVRSVGIGHLIPSRGDPPPQPPPPPTLSRPTTKALQASRQVPFYLFTTGPDPPRPPSSPLPTPHPRIKPRSLSDCALRLNGINDSIGGRKISTVSAPSAFTQHPSRVIPGN